MSVGREWPRLDSQEWRERAACRGMGPDLFFPANDEGPLSTAAGKQVCAGCQVRAECLGEANTTPVEQYGIWGGVGARTRQRIRARQRGQAS